MTYCSQQSALDAQRGLHEKKTLQGVSGINNIHLVVYNYFVFK